ncbi:rCG28058 [Rattus norvegicus]|uniref:RCG28058 n=1 Tax=Rattus norvegicus TaxID=10116 RepID=A6IE15_RAT|nr:rCG28058 [Rattus norvegicus]
MENSKLFEKKNEELVRYLWEIGISISIPLRLAWLLPKIGSESPKEAGRDKQGLLKAQPGADTGPFNTSYWAKEETTAGKGRKADGIFKGKDCREPWNSLD